MNGSRRAWARTEFAETPEHDGRFVRCEIALAVEGATEYRLERIVQEQFRFNRSVHNLSVRSLCSTSYPAKLDMCPRETEWI